jgi:hypothetical protein
MKECERGGICLSHFFSISTISHYTSLHKETTLKEFILVVQIKTQTTIVWTVTKWILQKTLSQGDSNMAASTTLS